MIPVAFQVLLEATVLVLAIAFGFAVLIDLVRREG